MRIIGGEHRGRKIKQPPLDTVRPTKDKVREAVFSMIAESVPDAKVLDLFSGSGAYGLEALSRGAESCVFVEKDPECAKILEENVDLIKTREKSGIMIMDAVKAIGELGKNDRKFDLVFIDPPYNSNICRKTLIKINHYDILNSSGAVITEHSTDEDLPQEEDFSIYKQKTYGDISISIYKKRSG